MRARGITLIEVVASLVLVGTTAAMLLTAQGRSLEQLRATRELQTASDLARELITDWQLSAPAEQIPGAGRFDEHQGWRWVRTVAPYPYSTELVLQEVTLTIHRTNTWGDAQSLVTYTWLEPAHAQ